MASDYETPANSPNHAIVLFDGECNFCNGSVNFLLKRDIHRRLKFAALQSGAGQSLLRRFGMTGDVLGTMVLVLGDGCFLKSTAAIRAASELGGGWSWMAVLLIVPRPLRDFVYDLFAANRYRLFGRTPSCVVPTPELRDRFLL